MINPINHYAITSGQPGVINEEAYTTLELVGKCGAKVNECIDAVNEATTDVETFDSRITAAQETANDAASTANAALATATENGERITNVSAVALEGRSVAFSARATAESAQATAESASANAQYAKKYVDDVTIFQGFTWWTDPIVNGGELTQGFMEFLKSIVSQILNNTGKYYDLTQNNNGSVCNVLKFNGYCPASFIEYGQNCVGLMRLELYVFKPVGSFSDASILVHYNQNIASKSGGVGAGSIFDVVTTITLPAAVYSASNPYDPDDFFMNRLCTYNNYDFQL